MGEPNLVRSLLLTGMELDKLKVAASLNYQGSYATQVSNSFNIGRQGVNNATESIFSKLGVSNVFSAVAISLSKEYFSLDEVVGDLDLAVVLANLSPTAKAGLESLYARAMAQEPVELTAVPGLEGIIDFRPNHAQLAVLAYACSAQKRLNHKPF